MSPLLFVLEADTETQRGEALCTQGVGDRARGSRLPD